MKTCKTCKIEKDDCQYYSNDKSCKDCRTAKVRANREKNIEKYREFDRQRANNPERVAARAAYAKTDAGKAAIRRAHVKWENKHPKRKHAVTTVSNAVRDGRLLKQPCIVCGETEVEGHHPDYDRPLDVVWLCVAHHKQLHAEHEARLQQIQNVN